MLRTAIPPVLAGLSPLVSRYDLILCDVWGVVHDGTAAFADATAALERARGQDTAVVLVSNAPRPGAVVERQMAALGVPAASYDAIVTSGDVTRDELGRRPGARLFHLGPPRDLPNYEELDVALVDLDEADLVVCTGLLDDTKETPEDYAGLLARMRERGLPMLCANPDIVVERGAKRIWCAGALAESYAAIGGSVLYAGKPYPAIYRSALARAAAIRGKELKPDRVLVIGDGVRTDLAGAAGQGFDCLFVAAGIHAAELGLDARGEPDPARFAHVFAEAGAWPAAVIRRLVW
jgi:HAD superfamily hydrolase (TIGR01459 family)